MIQENWQGCNDPDTILHQLQEKVSPRRLRLAACAFGRRVWDHLSENDRRALEIAERYADKLASKSELQDARKKCRNSQFGEAITAGGAWESARSTSGATAWIAVISAPLLVGGVHVNALRKQAELLRDIFGMNPRGFPVDPHWLGWGQGTVRLLARAIYQERRFADVPVLADALEEAGCDNPDILSHCRSVEEHVRGCWVLDLFLEKQVNVGKSS
jgi:hypothetical protein